jgi:predicted PurR-regulated permease PerM
MTAPAAPAPSDIRLRPPTPRVTLLLVAAVVVALVLYLGREALSPFVVGLLIVWLLHPTVEWLHRRRLPRWLAILLVYALVVVVVILGVNLLVSAIVVEVRNFIEDLPDLSARLQEQLERLGELYAALDIPPELRELINTELARLAAEGIAIDVSAIIRPVFTSVGSLVGTIFGYLIIPVWAFYLLKDWVWLRAAFDRSLPPAWREDTLACVAIASQVFGRWIRGQLILCLTVGIATFIGLTALSVITGNPIFAQYAVLLSVIAGILELLPIVGPILAAIPAVLITATAGLVPALLTLGLYFVIQQVENTVLVPRIQSEATDLHPAAVIFVIIVGAAVAGFLGAILALPLTAAGRDIYRYLFRRLSPEPPSSAEAMAEALRIGPIVGPPVEPDDQGLEAGSAIPAPRSNPIDPPTTPGASDEPG